MWRIQTAIVETHGELDCFYFDVCFEPLLSLSLMAGNVKQNPIILYSNRTMRCDAIQRVSFSFIIIIYFYSTISLVGLVVMVTVTAAAAGVISYQLIESMY